MDSEDSEIERDSPLLKREGEIEALEALEIVGGGDQHHDDIDWMEWIGQATRTGGEYWNSFCMFLLNAPALFGSIWHSICDFCRRLVRIIYGQLLENMLNDIDFIQRYRLDKLWRELAVLQDSGDIDIIKFALIQSFPKMDRSELPKSILELMELTRDKNVTDISGTERVLKEIMHRRLVELWRALNTSRDYDYEIKDPLSQVLKITLKKWSFSNFFNYMHEHPDADGANIIKRVQQSGLRTVRQKK